MVDERTIEAAREVYDAIIERGMPVFREVAALIREHLMVRGEYSTADYSMGLLMLAAAAAKESGMPQNGFVFTAHMLYEMAPTEPKKSVEPS